MKKIRLLRFLYFFLCTVLIISNSDLLAIMVLIEPREIYEKANLVIVGRVESIRSDWSKEKVFEWIVGDKSKIIVTYTTIVVNQCLKGYTSSKKLTILTLGGTVENKTMEVEDEAGFTEGGEVLVFLEVFKRDLWRVIGGPQGKFTVKDGKVLYSSELIPLEIFQKKMQGILTYLTWQELIEKALVLYNQERYLEAINITTQALETAKERFGPDDSRIPKTLFLMAKLYKAEGELEKAEDSCRQSLAMYEKIFGPNTSEMVEPLITLGEIYSFQGKKFQVSEVYNLLGVIYGTRYHQQAVNYYQKAIEIDPRIHNKLQPRIEKLKEKGTGALPNVPGHR